MSGRIEAHPAENGMTGWDYGAIIALATVGFSLSYDALRQVAVAIHVRPSLSYAFPVVLDGFIAYGVRAIVFLRNRPFGARLYAWALFLTATGSSLWANAVHAITLNRGPMSGRSALHLGDSVVGVLSTLAPLALAGSVHLYILMSRTADPPARDHADNGPGLVRGPVPCSTNKRTTAGIGPLLEAGEAPPTLSAGPRPSVADEHTEPPVDLRKRVSAEAEAKPARVTDDVPSTHADEAHDGLDDGSGPRDSDGADHPDDDAEPNAAAVKEPAAPRTVRDRPDGEAPSVPDETNDPDDGWLDVLLPIARQASERAGRISRDAVAPAVRAHQPIGNERLGVLIARLKEEEEGAAKTPACSSSSLW